MNEADRIHLLQELGLDERVAEDPEQMKEVLRNIELKARPGTPVSGSHLPDQSAEKSSAEDDKTGHA